MLVTHYSAHTHTHTRRANQCRNTQFNYHYSLHVIYIILPYMIDDPPREFLCDDVIDNRRYVKLDVEFPTQINQKTYTKHYCHYILGCKCIV